MRPCLNNCLDYHSHNNEISFWLRILMNMRNAIRLMMMRLIKPWICPLSTQSNVNERSIGFEIQPNFNETLHYLWKCIFCNERIFYGTISIYGTSFHFNCMKKEIKMKVIEIIYLSISLQKSLFLNLSKKKF